MFRKFRTVSMFLLLLGSSTGVMYAANPDARGGMLHNKAVFVKVRSMMPVVLSSVPLW